MREKEEGEKKTLKIMNTVRAFCKKIRGRGMNVLGTLNEILGRKKRIGVRNT